MANDLSNRLVNKSIEAFILGIEIYNKPTIRYRVEGFSFFICNAWELMLKAHLIKTQGESSIYFTDNPGRTVSLEKCISLVFTNSKDPLRINLEKIIELRNTSTHFITEEYEMVYIPLFQACVLNYSEKIMKFHDFDITSIIPQNFLTLNVNIEAIENSTIVAKYPEEIATKLIKANDEITDLSHNNNQNFALRIEHHHFIVRDRAKATSLVGITSDAEAKVKIIKELKDPNNTHPYNMKGCIKDVKDQLKRVGLDDFTFNQYTFQLFVAYYGLKGNEKFCFTYNTNSQTLYSYSRQAIDLIVTEIKKDPENIIQNLKNSIKKS